MNKATQEKMIGWLYQFNRSDVKNIFQAYDKPSIAKIDSFDRLENKYSAYNMYKMRILGHNSNFYTLGVIYTDGTDYRFSVETYANTYTCGLYKCIDGMVDMYDLTTGEIFHTIDIDW